MSAVLPHEVWSHIVRYFTAAGMCCRLCIYVHYNSQMQHDTCSHAFLGFTHRLPVPYCIEMTRVIFFGSCAEIGNLMQVCKEWHRTLNSDLVWHELVKYGAHCVCLSSKFAPVSPFFFVLVVCFCVCFVANANYMCIADAILALTVIQLLCADRNGRKHINGTVE